MKKVKNVSKAVIASGIEVVIALTAAHLADVGPLSQTNSLPL
jgi:hypothetical protein